MLISLCVPTFNRASRLQQCLNALANALDTHADSQYFEICVSDNASTDDTEEVVARFNSRFPAFRKQRHAINLGFAGNYQSLFSLATGDWVVVIGDDDIATDETLNLLMIHLRGEHGTVVFRPSTAPLQNLVSTNTRGKQVFESLSSLFKSMDLFDLSFIGNVVFPRKAALVFTDCIDTRSAYPTVALAVKIACVSGLTQVTGRLIHDTAVERKWIQWQPIYTAIDTVRVVGMLVSPFVSKPITRKLLLKHLRSLPRSIMLVRASILPNLHENPYRSISIKNIYEVYSVDYFCVVLSVLVWLVFSIVPLRMGCWIVGLDSSLRSGTKESSTPTDMCFQESVEYTTTR